MWGFSDEICFQVDLQGLPVNSGRALKNTSEDAKKKTRRAYNFKPKPDLLKMYNAQNMGSGPFEDGYV